jgi:hypothetical protein
MTWSTWQRAHADLEQKTSSSAAEPEEPENTDPQPPHLFGGSISTY